MLENNELVVNDALIKRHLYSFDKSYLLDRQIKNLQKNINININKLEHDRKQQQLKHLKSLKDTKQETINNCKNLYSTFKKNNSSLGKNNKERLQAISFYMLMLQNEENYQTRRLFIVAEENSELLFFPENLSILSATPASYIQKQKSINNTLQAQSKDIALIELQNLKFEGLEIKLYNLFILKDKIAIKRILNSIELIGEAESVPYFHLAQGYYYELNNQTEQAIEEYGQADIPQIIESALKRIALISLEKGEIEYAHNTLLLLSEISPAYLPQLAELYSLTKNYKDALDTYTHYLAYDPSDISVLLKVGELYESQKIFDGAQFIYKEILNLEANNFLAQKILDIISI